MTSLDFFSKTITKPLHLRCAPYYSKLQEYLIPGACFSKVPKLFEPISGATIPFISSQRRGCKPSNFAILLAFLTLKTCQKIGFLKQGDGSLITGFSGPKRSRDFRETGPRRVETLVGFESFAFYRCYSDVLFTSTFKANTDSHGENSIFFG